MNIVFSVARAYDQKCLKILIGQGVLQTTVGVAPNINSFARRFFNNDVYVRLRNAKA